MNLRLNKLAEMVDPGSRLADIGTDHAYLPIKLVQEGKVAFAIASDVAAGPLQNAKTDIAEAGLGQQIVCLALRLLNPALRLAAVPDGRAHRIDLLNDPAHFLAQRLVSVRLCEVHRPRQRVEIKACSAR